MDLSAFQENQEIFGNSKIDCLCSEVRSQKSAVFLAARQSISWMIIKHGNWNPTWRCHFWYKKGSTLWWHQKWLVNYALYMSHVLVHMEHHHCKWKIFPVNIAVFSYATDDFMGKSEMVDRNPLPYPPYHSHPGVLEDDDP